MAIKTVKATIEGQQYDLTWDADSQSYKATISAPSKSSFNKNDEHYYPVSITATDDGGNETTVNDKSPEFGEQLKLRVVEKVAPTITVEYPTASSAITSSTPTFRWTVKDDDSGVNPATISITIDEGARVTEGIQKSPTDGGYTCQYTPSALDDGNHTFKLNVSDNDGNAATEVSTAFKIDTVPPALTVTSPADNMVTNASTITVSGTTNDITSGPVTLTVNDVPVDVEEDGAFTYEFTLTEGDNTITIVATDSAGKQTTIVRHVKLDTGAPTFQEITITPNPVDAGRTYIISVKVVDA